MSDVRNYCREFLIEFIELYKSLPALWKIKSKEYSDRNKKNEAYNLLIEKLKEVDPNANRDMVTKKINSLRSSRRKEKKKVKDSLKSGASADDIYRPSLWYYDLLEFVDDEETVRNPISNFLDSLEYEDNTDTASNTGLSETGSNASPLINSPLECQPSASDSNDQRSSSTTRGLPPRCPGGKRGRELDDTISSIGKRLSEATKEDSHDAFGRNVAHKLRNLPSDQRIFLEKIINDAIFEAELGNLNRNCCVYVPAPTYLNVAANPPMVSMPLNRAQSCTATTLSQVSVLPETQLTASQNDSVRVNYNSNDSENTTLTKYINNYKS